jgi:hypothetical protein
MVPIRSAAIRTSTKGTTSQLRFGQRRLDFDQTRRVRRSCSADGDLDSRPSRPVTDAFDVHVNSANRQPRRTPVSHPGPATQTTRTYVEIRSAKLLLTLRLTSTAMAQPTIRSSPTCPLLTTSARAAHWKICCPPTSTTSVSPCDPIEAAGLQCASNMAMAFSRRSM